MNKQTSRQSLSILVAASLIFTLTVVSGLALRMQKIPAIVQVGSETAAVQ